MRIADQYSVNSHVKKNDVIISRNSSQLKMDNRAYFSETIGCNRESIKFCTVQFHHPLHFFQVSLLQLRVLTWNDNAKLIQHDVIAFHSISSASFIYHIDFVSVHFEDVFASRICDCLHCWQWCAAVKQLLKCLLLFVNLAQLANFASTLLN